jgi:hypothetical protein
LITDCLEEQYNIRIYREELLGDLKEGGKQ